jgi:hypothetical protein
MGRTLCLALTLSYPNKKGILTDGGKICCHPPKTDSRHNAGGAFSLIYVPPINNWLLPSIYSCLQKSCLKPNHPQVPCTPNPLNIPPPCADPPNPSLNLRHVKTQGGGSLISYNFFWAINFSS